MVWIKWTVACDRAWCHSGNNKSLRRGDPNSCDKWPEISLLDAVGKERLQKIAKEELPEPWRDRAHHARCQITGCQSLSRLAGHQRHALMAVLGGDEKTWSSRIWRTLGVREDEWYEDARRFIRAGGRTIHRPGMEECRETQRECAA